jgi:hypothetical protein
MKSKTALTQALLLIFLTGCALTHEGPEPTAPSPAETSPTLQSPSATVSPTPDPTATPAPTKPPLPTHTPSPTPFQCWDYQHSVLLLVEDIYLSPLKDAFQQYEEDLCRDHYRVIIKENDFATPGEIRAYLADLYFNHPELNLIGVTLIGDIPHAYQQMTVEYANPDIPTAIREFVSVQYYADLDGGFALSEDYQPKNGTAPVGEPMLDVHRGEIDWEIWVSVLPPYMEDRAKTVAALRRYFQKNHAYRTGGIDLPKTYLMIMAYNAESKETYEQVMNSCCKGTDNWTALDREGGVRQIFMDNPVDDMSEEAGYRALSEGKADFTLIFDHGNVSSLGRINPPWLEENDLSTIFLFNHSCSVGNVDNPNVILTQILYHPNSQVLFSIGNTTEGGGLCTNEEGSPSSNISAGLMSGMSIGEALLNHINIPLIEPWSDDPENCFALKILFGDPTLMLRQ